MFSVGMKMEYSHYVKSVRIRSYSGPYSVQMRDIAEQNKSKYGHFSRSVYWLKRVYQNKCFHFSQKLLAQSETELFRLGNYMSETPRKSRSSPPEVLLGKGALKICNKFTGEQPCQSTISIKLQSTFCYEHFWKAASVNAVL